tara:strand:+ start:3855 stop:4316 length:462 start_codon:yes stop_codon:yes gene_type:complete
MTKKQYSQKSISASVVVPYSRSQIFDVISNPRLHSEFDGSESVKGLVNGGPLNAVGDSFKAKMKMWGIRYRVKSTVVEYEKDHLIAWAHLGKHRWRYKLDDVPDGTRITETFDWSYSVFPRLIEVAGYPESHPENIERTLQRLANFLANNAQP